MQISIGDIIDAESIASAHAAIAAAEFVDGRETAGWSAALVKNNEQARLDDGTEHVQQHLCATLIAHPVFDLAVRPKLIIKTLLSRYRPGHSYGRHVDNAVMDGERTDVSFTLFLSDPSSYDGGALVIEDASGEQAIKLPAGSLVAYPSNTLHRVEPVTRGERLAMVGWIRSFIRDPARREMLFDLDTARRTLFDREGKSAEADLLAKCAANLLRMWVED